MSHILVIEDDARMRSALLRALAAHGYVTSAAATGMVGLQAALDDPPDLVLLDLGLPDVDGAELLRMLRAVSRVPVIVATARDDESQIVAALDRGADDYLVKPFGIGQLDARIRAVLRRSADQPRDRSRRTVGGLVIDVAARTAAVDGAAIELSPREFDMLCYLAERVGEVVSRRELLAAVWRLPYGGSDKTVDVHLSWLRRKLGETAQEPRYLHTVRGVGVRLAAPPSPPSTGLEG